MTSSSSVTIAPAGQSDYIAANSTLEAIAGSRRLTIEGTRIIALAAEDDNVRIEETRVRGESVRIVVKPKSGGGREYEIVPATGAVDPSQPSNRRVGDRVWRLFSF